MYRAVDAHFGLLVLDTLEFFVGQISSYPFYDKA